MPNLFRLLSCLKHVQATGHDVAAAVVSASGGRRTVIHRRNLPLCSRCCLAIRPMLVRRPGRPDFRRNLSKQERSLIPARLAESFQSRRIRSESPATSVVRLKVRPTTAAGVPVDIRQVSSRLPAALSSCPGDSCPAKKISEMLFGASLCDVTKREIQAPRMSIVALHRFPKTNTEQQTIDAMCRVFLFRVFQTWSPR